MPEATMKYILNAEDRTKVALESAKGNLQSISNAAEKMKPAFQGMATYGGLAFAAIAGEATVAAKAFAESQAELAIADTVIRNMGEKTLKQLGGSVESASEKVREFGTKLQEMGGIGDEEATVAVTKLTTATGNYEKAQKLAMLAADISKYKHIDYGTAVDLVGKVQNGNVAILQRYGIQIDKNATAEEAITALTKKAAGQYEAYGKTMAGQSDIMKEKIGDLQENIGQALVPVMQRLFDAIIPVVKAVVDWTAKNPDLVLKIIVATGAIAGIVTALGTLGFAIPAIITGITAIGSALMFLAANPIGIVITAIAAISAAVYLLWTRNEAFRNGVMSLWDALQNSLGPALSQLWKALTDLWTVIKQSLGPVLKQLWDALQPLQPVLEFIGKVIGITIYLAILATVKYIENWIKAITTLIEWLKPLVAYLGKELTDALNKASGPIKAIGAAFVTVSGAISGAIGKFKQWAGLSGGPTVSGGGFGGGGGMSFDEGGVVPGYVGQPILATVHGGEMVLTPEQQKQRSGNTFNFTFNGEVADRDTLIRTLVDAVNRATAVQAAAKAW